MALSGDTALIGAYGDNNFSGSAYVYQFLTPEQSIQNVIADVDALAASGILKRGQARGLTRPLENALQCLARNDTPAACSQLADFIAEVHEKAPDPLPQPEADALIMSADAIRAALGCTTYE